MTDEKFDKEFLLNLLLAYAEKIKEVTEKVDKSRLSSIPYEKIPLKSFERKPWQISFHYDYENIEYFEEFEWGIMDFADYHNKLLQLEEALTIGNYILKWRPDAHNGVSGIIHYTLSNFTRYILDDVIDNFYDKESITRWSNILSNDIDLLIHHKTDLMEWKISLELANFYVGDIPLINENGSSFIPFTKEDYELVRIKSSHIEEKDKMFSKSTNITTKLTFNSIAPKDKGTGFYPEKIKQEIDTELNLLRLFKVVSVYHVSEIVIPNSLIKTGTQFSKEIPSETYSSDKVGYDDWGPFSMIITESDFMIFQEFRKKLHSLISQINPKKYLDGDYIDIAFHRYLDALLRSEVYAYRILSAISSLEALLTNNESEVGFKLKSRLALLLSCLNISSKDVSKTITEAYDLRSKIVHGDKLKENQFNFARESCIHVLNYARLAFLISVQLRKEYNKQKFISFLNDALIDKTDYELLKEKVKNLTISL